MLTKQLGAQQPKAKAITYAGLLLHLDLLVGRKLQAGRVATSRQGCEGVGEQI